MKNRKIDAGLKRKNFIFEHESHKSHEFRWRGALDY